MIKRLVAIITVAALFLETSNAAYASFRHETEAGCLRPVASAQRLTPGQHTLPGLLPEEAGKSDRELLESLGIKPQTDHQAERFLHSLESVRSIKEPVRVVFIMPMYKEEKRLKPKSESNPLGEDALRQKVKELYALNSINPLFKGRIIAVDDGSPGASSADCVRKLWQEIRQEYAGRNIILEENLVTVEVITPGQKRLLGSKKGGAVIFGMKKALEDNWADYIGYTDTDISTNLFQAAALLEPLYDGESDVAIGSRWCREGTSENVPLSGIVSSKIYNWSVRLLMTSLKNISDTQRGFKLFRKEALKDILPFALDNTWAFDTELLLLSALAGYRLKEVGIAWYDSPEATTLNMYKEGPSMLRSLISQRRHMFKGHFDYKMQRPHMALPETTPSFGKHSFLYRLTGVSIVTVLLSALVAVLSMGGYLGWYASLRSAASGTGIIHWAGMTADMVTGMMIWGVSDIIGQYLNQGRNIRFKQSLIVGFFGIFQGIFTHVLFGAIDAITRLSASPPYLPPDFGVGILRTAMALTGGLMISVLLARAISLGRKITKVEGYSEKKEWQKAGDVIMTKLVVAPVKTYIVINLLPFHVRVLASQVCDYLLTLFSAYLMNRREALFTKSISQLRKGKTIPGLKESKDTVNRGVSSVVFPKENTASRIENTLKSEGKAAKPSGKEESTQTQTKSSSVGAVYPEGPIAVGVDRQVPASLSLKNLYIQRQLASAA